MVGKCNAVTNAGKQCKGKVLPGRPYCMAHDPEYAERRAEGQRKGGEARANAKRAVRLWAAAGEQMRNDDLAAILKSCMLSVKAGTLEPSQATAILNLAKGAVSITNDLQLEERIKALEEASGIQPSNLRRIA